MDGYEGEVNREAKVRLVGALGGKGAHLSFEHAVADFPDELMNARPDNVPYTFWHTLEHICICQVDMYRYITDPEYVSPEWPARYWPAPDAHADRETWDATIARYLAERDDFTGLIERDDIDVLAPVKHNAGRSILGSAMIIIDHTAYHLGEFVMGRQISGAWKSELG